MSERENQLLDDRHEQLMQAINGVHDRLDVLNGRTRKLEVEQGILKWIVGTVSASITAFFVWLVKG